MFLSLAAFVHRPEFRASLHYDPNEQAYIFIDNSGDPIEGAEWVAVLMMKKAAMVAGGAAVAVDLLRV